MHLPTNMGSQNGFDLGQEMEADRRQVARLAEELRGAKSEAVELKKRPGLKAQPARVLGPSGSGVCAWGGGVEVGWGVVGWGGAGWGGGGGVGGSICFSLVHVAWMLGL